MSFTMKLVLVLFGLAYLISPVDLIPDLLLPWVGWIDDGVIVWSIYYLIRYGELPWFLFRKNTGKRFPGRPTGPGPRTNTSGQNNKKDKKKPNPHSEKTNSSRPGNARPVSSPYEILGVAKTASWQEIQTAYKEKIKQYHPDKLSHLGDEFADLANEKFLEIQTAYGQLKKNNND